MVFRAYFRLFKPDINLVLRSRIPITPEDSSGLVDSSKDRAHGSLHQGDSQTLSGTGSRPARWGLTAAGTRRERRKTKW
ncbi:hypothetical protein CHARACLAT_026821 [Characodon lateralis]|uniref:Uncharacterized protein n=1 Tax=Characodon lateralis TaxID=208331 RepID=A0ABU7ENV0_9TELE|nr:hypothetical protein [Characodon lateralis]